MVTKSDGAGDTQVEGDKGAISDAFKRAAVKFGVGRYLYDMEAVYVKCETHKDGKFKSFSEDPWDAVQKKLGKLSPHSTTPEPDLKIDGMTYDERAAYIGDIMEAAPNVESLNATWKEFTKDINLIKINSPEKHKFLVGLGKHLKENFLKD